MAARKVRVMNIHNSGDYFCTSFVCIDTSLCGRLRVYQTN